MINALFFNTLDGFVTSLPQLGHLTIVNPSIQFLNNDRRKKLIELFIHLCSNAFHVSKIR
jgi:hypothetical protein